MASLLEMLLGLNYDVLIGDASVQYRMRIICKAIQNI